MKFIKSLIFIALAATLTFSFVACSDDDSGERTENGVINYENSRVLFSCECIGNFYRLVNLSVEVFVNNQEIKEFSYAYDGNSVKVQIDKVNPLSTITINVNADRNKTAVSPTTIYNRMITPSFYVNRIFSDGTIVNGGNIVLDVDNISDINKEIIEDYITNNGDRSYTIRLDDKGALRK